MIRNARSVIDQCRDPKVRQAAIARPAVQIDVDLHLVTNVISRYVSPNTADPSRRPCSGDRYQETAAPFG
jgi:hypothetical protein